MNLIDAEKKKYIDFKKKIELEFKKFDSSSNFFNCLENIYFLKIPIERIENVYSTVVYYKINAENSYLFPNDAFSEQLNRYYISTMKSFDVNQVELTLDALRDELEYCTEADFCDLDNLNNLDDYIVWAGRAGFHHKSPYLEIPILLFNRSKLEYRYPLHLPLHFRIKEFWEQHWEYDSYYEIGRKVASSFHYNLDKTINDIHVISSFKYEGIECKGRMLLCNQKHLIYDIDIELIETVSIKDHKRIRKLLEITNDNLILAIDTRDFTAIGYKRIKDEIQLKDDDIYISFKGLFSWECKTSDIKTLFYFEHMQLKFPIDTTNEFNSFKEKFNLTFNKVLSNECEIINIVKNIKKQKKGSMLVILDTLTAKNEGERLKSSSTLIKRVDKMSENILDLSKIDGAIIIDSAGYCHSFGVILDGGNANGDPGRGARYNSAQRYLNTKLKSKIACMIVVVSEDGYIDVLSTQDLIKD